MAFGEAWNEVLVAAQGGAEWAFGRLYDEFNPRLERYFAARAPQAAEDLAADVWMGVARAFDRFGGGEAGFRSWIFTMAHRRMADYWEEIRIRPVGNSTDPSKLDRAIAPDDPEHEVLAAVSARAAVHRIASVL